MSSRIPALLAVPLGLVLAVSAAGACDALDAPDAGAAERPRPAAAAAPDTVDGADVGLGHTLGDPAAPVAVVEFSDFGCPYCARFARSTLPELQQEFIEAGLVRWRYVPVTFGFPGGQLMAAAAECAADQGGAPAFWRAHDLFYQRQVALRAEGARPRLLEWLSEEGLDRAELEACLDDPSIQERLNAHNAAAQQWFVRGTPTFVVNGVPMSGAMPTEFFRRVFRTVLDPSGL